MKVGIVGHQAPELRVSYWIDGSGEKRNPLTLAELGVGYKILFFYQHWCPGCHLHGFPRLKRLITHLENRGVGFAVIQTVFEGNEENTVDKLALDQERHHLHIPFGHDASVGNNHPSNTMQDYATGGTPWFVLIDPKGLVIYNDFLLDFEEFITLVKHD